MEVRGQKAEISLPRVVTVIIFATEDTEVTEGGLPAGVRERLTVQALSRTLSELMRSALKALT